MILTVFFWVEVGYVFRVWCHELGDFDDGVEVAFYGGADCDGHFDGM